MSVLFLFTSVQKSTENSLISSNIAALARNESSFDCSYVRHDGQCTIHISADLAAVLGLHADGDGNVRIDGKLSCERGGKLSCTPIECIDLYKSLGIFQ